MFQSCLDLVYIQQVHRFAGIGKAFLHEDDLNVQGEMDEQDERDVEKEDEELFSMYFAVNVELS